MDDRRTSQRQRTLKGGLIAFNDDRSTVTCTVRNLSDSGARLAVASIVGIPDSFVLRLTDKTKRDCRVVWRKPTELGVTFDSALAG